MIANTFLDIVSWEFLRLCEALLVVAYLGWLALLATLCLHNACSALPVRLHDVIDACFGAAGSLRLYHWEGIQHILSSLHRVGHK